MKSELISSFDIGARIFKALVQSVQDAGGSDEDARRIETDSELRKKIGELVVSTGTSGPPTIDFDPSAPFARDMRKEGWKLEDPTSEFAGEAGPLTLELCEFLESGESCISGEEMVRRAIGKGAALGQKHAEAFLKKYERWVPPKGVRYIALPGTILRDSDGDRLVPCLCWDGGRWWLGFDWLENDWRGSDRLLRPRK